MYKQEDTIKILNRKLNSNLCAKLADPVNKNYMICEIDDVETHSGWKFIYK